MPKVKTVETVEKKDLVPYETKIQKAEKEVFDLIILNQKDYETAIELANRLNQTKKVIEAKRKSLTEPIKQSVKDIEEMFKPMEKRLETMIEQIKSRSIEYVTAEEKRIADEKAKIDKKLDDGRLKPETAIRKTQELGTVEKTTQTEAGRMIMKTVKVVKIINEADIPREYLVPDMAKIKADIKAGKEIKGVEVVEEKQASL